MLHCDGKCVLAKKLKQEENKDQQNPERKMENKNEVLSSKSFFTVPLFVSIKLNKKYFEFSDTRVFDISPLIFHPPCC